MNRFEGTQSRVQSMILKPFFLSVSLCLIALTACSPDPTDPEPVAIDGTGEDLARRLCAQCHAIGADDRSQHPGALPFRDLNKLYPVEHLAEALAEGIIVGHPRMPVFELTPDQISAFLSYLEEVQAEASPSD